MLQPATLKTHEQIHTKLKLKIKQTQKQSA